MNTRKSPAVWALVFALLLTVSTAAFAEDEGSRPTAPELHPAPAVSLSADKQEAPAKAEAKKSPKKKAAKKPTSTSEGLQLAPAPLMIQKP